MAGKNQGELKEIFGSCFSSCEKTFDCENIKELIFGNRINIVRNGEKLISRVNGKQTNEFDEKVFNKLREDLKKEILENSNEKGTVSLPSIKKIEKLLGTTKLKTPNKYKEDLIIITDKNTYFCSIKGKTNSRATLLNPSVLTCPKYEIVGLTKEKFEKELKDKERTELMNYLVSNYELNFCGFHTEGDNDFNVVLRKIHQDLPEILGEVVLNKFRLNNCHVKDLTSHKEEILRLINFLYNGTTSTKLVTIDPNIKQKELVVNKDCSVTINNCDKKYFEEIFNKLVVDVGSEKRYNFGKIFYENGKYYIKWNLQLRF